MVKMKMFVGLLCLVYCLPVVASEESTPNPHTIRGEVTKTDNSDITVAIALGVGTFLLIVAFIIVVIINKIKNRSHGKHDATVEHGKSSTGYSNGNNNADEKNMIPMYKVNTISVQNETPNNDDQAIVKENADEVNSALVTTEISSHDKQDHVKESPEDSNSAVITTEKEPRNENTQSQSRHSNGLVNSAFVGGASLLAGANLLDGDNPDPELQERIVDSIDNDVIKNAPQNFEQEMSHNTFVNNAFVVGSDKLDEDPDSERSPSEKEFEQDFEDSEKELEESEIPAPPPSVDYLEAVEHELVEEAREPHMEAEFPNPPNDIFIEGDTIEFGEEDLQSFHPNNLPDNSYNYTDHVDYDKEPIDEVPTFPSDHKAIDVQEPVKDVATKGTTSSTDSSQSDYLRSIMPPPLDLDNIVIISKD